MTKTGRECGPREAGSSLGRGKGRPLSPLELWGKALERAVRTIKLKKPRDRARCFVTPSPPICSRSATTCASSSGAVGPRFDPDDGALHAGEPEARRPDQEPAGPPGHQARRRARVVGGAVRRPPLPVAGQGPPRPTVGAIVRAHGEAYRAQHPLSDAQRKVMRDIGCLPEPLSWAGASTCAPIAARSDRSFTRAETATARAVRR